MGIVRTFISTLSKKVRKAPRKVSEICSPQPIEAFEDELTRRALNIVFDIIITNPEASGFIGQDQALQYLASRNSAQGLTAMQWSILRKLAWCQEAGETDILYFHRMMQKWSYDTMLREASKPRGSSMLSDAHMGWWEIFNLIRDRDDRDHDHGDAYETFYTDEWFFGYASFDGCDYAMAEILGECDETRTWEWCVGCMTSTELVHAYTHGTIDTPQPATIHFLKQHFSGLNLLMAMDKAGLLREHGNEVVHTLSNEPFKVKEGSSFYWAMNSIPSRRDRHIRDFHVKFAACGTELEYGKKYCELIKIFTL
jgi:hypothetical protein